MSIWSCTHTRHQALGNQVGMAVLVCVYRSCAGLMSIVYMCQTCIVLNFDEKGTFFCFWLPLFLFPLLFLSQLLNSLRWGGSGGCHCYSGKKALRCFKVFKRNQRLIGAMGIRECNGWKWWRLRGESCSQVDIIEKVIKIKAITRRGALEGSCSAARGQAGPWVCLVSG